MFTFPDLCNILRSIELEVFPCFTFRSTAPKYPLAVPLDLPNLSIHRLHLSMCRAQVSACFAFRSIEPKYPHALSFDLSSPSIRMLCLSIYRAQVSACCTFRSIEPKYPHALSFDLSSPSIIVLYFSIYRAQVSACCTTASDVPVAPMWQGGGVNWYQTAVIAASQGLEGWLMTKKGATFLSGLADNRN
jgi:hypothetical protein